MSHRKRCLSRVPPWQSLEDLELPYLESKKLTAATGIRYSVDHIDPLNGNLVCGLHCLENLQVITVKQNAAKGNNFVPYRVDYLGNRWLLNGNQWLPDKYLQSLGYCGYNAKTA